MLTPQLGYPRTTDGEQPCWRNDSADGESYVQVELRGVFARLGSEVTLVPTAEPTVRFTVLGPDLANLAQARDFVRGVAREAGFADERIFDIAVAASEAMANAVEHAPVKGNVQVRALLFPDRLEVQVEGPGEFRAPPDGRNERSGRGLGFPLMAKLADDLALCSGPEGSTLVCLTFHRSGHHLPVLAER